MEAVASSGAVTAESKAGTADGAFKQFFGFSLRETAGAAASVEFRDGTATGKLLCARQMLASLADPAPVSFAYGLDTANGIFVHIVTGSAVEVIVYGV